MLVVPHAGYVYSGPVAAQAYALLAPWRGHIRRVVVLGPTHRVAVRGLALPDVSAFATPLGRVELDPDAPSRLSGLSQVRVNAEAHAQEHSLEVQLPFLQRALGTFTLVPLAVGEASAAQVAQVLERLWGGDETLVVISTDLSHYLSYAQAQARDRATVERILQLDPALDHCPGLRRHAAGRRIAGGASACTGSPPARPAQLGRHGGRPDPRGGLLRHRLRGTPRHGRANSTMPAPKTTTPCWPAHC